MQNLISKLQKKEARLGVLGLGYVGLPLAVSFAKAGFKVTGFDLDQTKVDQLNAGKSYIIDISDEEFFRIINTNVAAVFHACQVFGEHFIDAGRPASIINVGSLAGRAPIPGSASYAASKAGLRSFTYALGIELADRNIKLAVVSPGPIDTGFIMADIDSTSDLTLSQPISTAEEVAQAVLDLCGNKIREQSMPKISGFLTMLMYLFPGLNPLIRPGLERKGARVKAKLKAERKRRESDSPDR